MKRFNKYLAATSLSAAILLPSMVQAMEIQQYDKMASQDRGEYVADLIKGAEKILKDTGRADQAAQVSKLFTTILGNDKASVGVLEFYRNLLLARAADQQNVKKDAKAVRLEVEDALGVALKKNGIELPDSFFTVMKNFKPKHPPKNADTPAPPPAKAAAPTNAVPSIPAVAPAPASPATAQPPVAPAPTNAAPASTPAPNQNMTPDDDPIGEGGFITPPGNNGH